MVLFAESLPIHKRITRLDATVAEGYDVIELGRRSDIASLVAFDAKRVAREVLAPNALKL